MGQVRDACASFCDLVETGADARRRARGAEDSVMRVAVALDRVGYMVKQGLIPDDALFEWQQDEIQQLWEKLQPIVKYVQKTRNRPHYCK